MSEQADTALGKDRPRVQRLVRGVCAIVALVLLWHAGGSVVVPALSPFVVLGAWLATRTIRILAVIGLVVGCIVLLHPRWFCRWVCPMGYCADGVSRLGRRLGRRPTKWLPLGQWILWLTIGGGLFGWPLLLWLDPLSIFAGLMSITTVGNSRGAWLLALPATVVLLLSLIWPYLWCGRLCPLGALQDVLSHLAKAGRKLVRLHRQKVPVMNDGLPLARRAVFGAAVGAVSASALRAAGTPISLPLRPPTALGEAEFVAACLRCGNCIRVCPTKIIRPDLGEHGLASLLTPTLSFEKGYCPDGCVLCTGVCPSGALRRVVRKGSKRYIRMGLAKVDMNICLLGADRECAECRRWCPYGAIRYVFSESEYCLVPQIDAAKCNGCGACEMACPTKPQKAIAVRPLPER